MVNGCRCLGDCSKSIRQLRGSRDGEEDSPLNGDTIVIFLHRYPTAEQYQVVSRALVVAYPKLLDDSDGGYVSMMKPAILFRQLSKHLEPEFTFVFDKWPHVN